MGGSESGRHWRFNAKETTSNYRKIDIRRWKRDDMLYPHHAFNWQWLHLGEVVSSISVTPHSEHIELKYQTRDNEHGEWKSKHYIISLAFTECHLGGTRPWFLCPAQGCGRRVALLYSCGIYVCRHCLNLAYASQHEALHDRAARQADKIREKLKWEPGILNGKEIKPKGMHWKTYERLCAKHDELVEISINAMEQRFGSLGIDIKNWL